MTKPLPTGCIEDDSDISWETFHILLENISFEDEIGHMYMVDIKLDVKNVTERQLVYNEIYPPIIEKQKIIDPRERPTIQLLDNFSQGENGASAYRSTAKTHGTMLEKKCIPLYLEDLAFIIKRVGWKVTKIHSHLTFEQKRFKKNFILMNQKSRQESKNNVEKNFFKLLNNSNFGYDRRNNMDNCDFVPIFDNIGEVQKIQKYYNLFDPKVAQFLSGELMKDSIEEQYNNQLHKLNKNNPFYQIKLSSLNHERLAGLEAAKNFDEKKKKQKRKLTLIDYSERISEAHKNTSIKSLIDFGNEYSSSIKAVAIKQSTNVKVTARFISGKMQMFANVC